jgi:hypothetical protein
MYQCKFNVKGFINMGSQVNFMLITLYDVEIIPFKGDIPEDSYVVETYDSAIDGTITCICYAH